MRYCFAILILRFHKNKVGLCINYTIMNKTSTDAQIEFLANLFKDQLSLIDPTFLKVNGVRKSLHLYIQISKILDSTEKNLQVTNHIEYLNFKRNMLGTQKDILNNLNVDFADKEKKCVLIVLKMIEKKNKQVLQSFLSLSGFRAN